MSDDHHKVPLIFDAGAIKSRAYALGQRDVQKTLVSPKTDSAVPRTAVSASVVLDPALAYADNFSDVEFAQELRDAVAGLSNRERNKVLSKMIARRRREIDREIIDQDKKRDQLDRLKRVRDAYIELRDWARRGIKMERAGGSVFRNFRADVRRGRAIHLARSQKDPFPSEDYEKEFLRLAEVFVVQHDWAAAFARAEDLAGVQFRLPYDTCAFEFQVSGRRIIALATEVDGVVSFTPATWSEFGWIIPDFVWSYASGAWTESQSRVDVSDAYPPIIKLIGDQLRAVCIALDADVATAQVERAPHAHQHGKNITTPPRSYSVVVLSRRERTAPRLESSSGEHARRRMHFRRGHWRHYDAFKTWIRWTLVGDPDLGFIDKEYRL